MMLMLLAIRLYAAEFENPAAGIAKILGTTRALKRKVVVEGKDVDVFSPKDGGKVRAVVERGTYPPNCTHTWVIGTNDGEHISEIRVSEMSCPHAFPCRSAGFLKQYVGKGPADLAKLDRKVETLAQATGSSELTTQAVKRAILAFQKEKQR